VGRLRDWLEASRESLRVQRRLAIAAAEWATANRDTNLLAAGARLTEFQTLAEAGVLALNAEELAYLQGSVAEREAQQMQEEAVRQREVAQAQTLAEEQRRRADDQGRAARTLRRRAIYLAGALLLALIAATAAGFFATSNGTLAAQNAMVASTAQAAEQQAIAEAQSRATQQALAENNFVRSEQQHLAAEANSALDRSHDAQLAALLALRSLRIGYSPKQMAHCCAS
jgi:hypothetical protein